MTYFLEWLLSTYWSLVLLFPLFAVGPDVVGFFLEAAALAALGPPAPPAAVSPGTPSY